jgi:hypothetical protein
MDLFALHHPEPERYPIDLSPRWRVVVLLAPTGALMLGFFLDGELIYATDRMAGKA